MEEISRLIDTLRPLLPERCVISGGPISNRVSDISRTELALVRSAAIRRQREFACGRYYAHQVLQILGQDFPVIDRNKDGSPQWPPNIVGSISHTGTYCIVAAGTAADIVSMGIDLEESRRLNPDLWSRLFTSCELKAINDTNDPAGQRRRAAAIFSAKEAFYKCDFPLKKYTGFRNIEISLKKNNNLKFFHVESNAAICYEGFYCSGLNYVLTIVIKAQI